MKIPPSLVEVESSSVSRDWGKIVRDEHGAEYRSIDEHQQDRCRNRVEGKDGRYAVANAHGVNPTHNGAEQRRRNDCHSPCRQAKSLPRHATYTDHTNDFNPQIVLRARIQSHVEP